MKKSEMESLETELLEAKKAVRDLASKIEDSNLRSKGLNRKPKWRQQDVPETSVNNEDDRYAKVMNELEHMKQELSKLKVDMARVVKEKRHAERSTKASGLRRMNLLASVELMKKELKELAEEKALVEFVGTEDETKTNELQLMVSDVNMVKENMSPLNTIEEEIEGARRELEMVKGEGFKFMTSMDVVRGELKHVKDETARLQKAEQKRDVRVQSLNSKILRAKAKLESVTLSELNSNTVVSNLVFTLEKLRVEAETAKKEKETVMEEIENMNGEIRKTEYEVNVGEERLEAVIKELEAIRSSEAKAMGNLRNLIKTTMEVRDVDSANGSTIKITNFEYEYLTRKAGGAAELADKKIAAAHAWVEALKASEKELLMKIEMTQNEIGELSIEVEAEAGAEAPGSGLKENVLDSPRRSIKRVGNRTSVKLARLQTLRSPAARYSGKSGSTKREKKMPKLRKLFSKKSVAMDERVV